MLSIPVPLHILWLWLAMNIGRSSARAPEISSPLQQLGLSRGVAGMPMAEDLLRHHVLPRENSAVGVLEGFEPSFDN